MIKLKNLSKVISLMIGLILFCNFLALQTNRVIHFYFGIFILCIFILNKFITFNYDKINLTLLKYKKITFILCIIILVLQFISFYFIYPLLYENSNFMFGNIIISLIFIHLIGCLIEEIIFRGFSFNLMKYNFSSKSKICISTLLFVIYHLIIFYDINSITDIIITIIFTGLAGLCLGYIYIKTNNLMTVTLIHSIYNITQNIISIEYNLINIDSKYIYIPIVYSSFIFIFIFISFNLYGKYKLKHTKNI